MVFIAIICGAVLYSVGVLTGVYVGFSMAKASREYDKETVLTQEDRAKILELTSAKNKVTYKDVQKLLSVSDFTAQRYLVKLANSGQLERHGKSTKIYYTTPVKNIDS